MKKVLDFVQRFDLLPRYELLLAAASGGMDSMCLLDFLYENGYRVCAAHYNHQLRGQEADMDEDLVRAWCAARRIPLCVGTGDVAAYAGETGLTVEEAARKLRYDFLNSVAGQTGAARIVTAHHANDNAETVLFHLARGTGMAGLAGIAPKNGRLVRPFLCLTREELAAYAKEHHVPYRTDATNADTALTRNFIRAEVLPKLCRVNAQAVEHISETALRLRQEDEYLDSLAAAYLTELKTEAGAVTLPQMAQVADAFYIGGTKNGALFGEAMVLLNEKLKPDFRYLIKRHGGMLAKGWLLGIQFETLMQGGLYEDLARHANTQALRLRDGAAALGIPFATESISNQQFLILPDEVAERLARQVSFEVSGKPDGGHTIARFVTSWATDPADVDTLLEILRGLL